MTTTQLTELLLLRLYDLANSRGHGEPIDLAAVAEEFGETDQMKVYTAGTILQSRGLIRAAFRYGGAIDAWITGDGELFVEQGGTTGVISAFRRDPSGFVSVDQSTHFHGPVSGSNVAVHSQVGNQSSPIPRDLTDFIDRIDGTLRQDLSLAEAQRRELFDDVQTLRDELQRQKPRSGILREILSTLADVSSVAGLVIQLLPLLPKF
jgi:hypothetical protein